MKSSRAILCCVLFLAGARSVANACDDLLGSELYVRIRHEYYAANRAVAKWEEMFGSSGVLYQVGFCIFDVMIQNHGSIEVPHLYRQVEIQCQRTEVTTRLMFGKLRAAGYVQSTRSGGKHWAQLTPEGRALLSKYFDSLWVPTNR